jgi:hypothetical protein
MEIFDKTKNQQERFAFIDFWTNYMKTHDDKEWSRQQAVLINSILRNKINKIRIE